MEQTFLQAPSSTVMLLKRTAISVLLTLIVSCKSDGQKIEYKMAPTDLAKLFPQYSNVFNNNDHLFGFDTIANFPLYSVNGKASFIFIGDHLTFFRWVYRDENLFSPFTQNDHLQLAKVIHGLKEDYGPGRKTRGNDCEWEVPNAIVGYNYSRNNFRFQIMDSTMAKNSFAPPPKR
jgi:hypothetical protein